MRSGFSMLRVVAFQVWNSMTFICAAPIKAVNESISIIAG